MAWSAKKVSVVAGALALLAELGLNNALVAGLGYVAATGIAAPVLVHGVIVAQEAEDSRLAADRHNFASRQSQEHHVSRAGQPGDADQPVRQSDEAAEDSPDMPRRLQPMLVARRAFLASYGTDAARSGQMLSLIESMLRDDRRAFASFAQRAAREPVWAAAHRNDLAELRGMDTRLGALLSRMAPD